MPPAVVSSTTTIDRRAEIEAIFLDLERRRLKAILDQDEEAYRAVFSNAEYEEESMVVMALLEVLNTSAVVFNVVEVTADTPDCIAVDATVDMSSVVEGGALSGVANYVIERDEIGWGFSWFGGEWKCNGPHPFSR